MRSFRLFGAAVLAASSFCVVLAGEDSSKNAEKVFTISTPGEYAIDFTYGRRENQFDNVSVRVIRESDGHTVAYRMIDYHSNYPAVPSAPKTPVCAAADVPATIPVNFETAGSYRVKVRGCYGALEKKQSHWGYFSPNPTVKNLRLREVKTRPAYVSGFKSARVHLPHASLNSSLPERERLQLCIHECYPFYEDLPALMDLGINMNLTGTGGDEAYERYGLPITKEIGFYPGKDFEKKYPGKVGKQANYRGQYQNDYSFSFKPFREACYSNAVRAVKKSVASATDKSVLNWYSAWEYCGTYDYGETSLEAFRHEYLPKKYGSLENLNKAWHQDYKSFDEVVPATYKMCVGKEKLADGLALARAKASFLDFRDFNSKEYATYLGLKTKAILENDPDHRNMTAAYSNNNLGSICWLKWRPLSFEDAMDYTLKGSKTMGWDIYGVDDLIAEAYEHWFSFGEGECHPMIKEANIHALGGELTARSFWNLLGEGMRGMAFFTSQESPKPELRKFGIHNPDDDMSPRPKCAAVSDLFRAASQLEPFMAYGERHSVSKPVAIFYDQNCNIMQERGYGSMFDCAPDSHMRVFEVIRACGYPCTIVTAKQILEKNALDKLAAVFFVDAQYLDSAVVTKLESWVRAGGHVIADGQTGAYDAHGFPTTKMLDFMGIKPLKSERLDESVAENLKFGYSSQAFKAVNADELWLSMREYIHQRDARHPIAKAAGKIMFSGFGAQEVKSLDGEVIVLGNDGEVGWNIRTLDKGSVSYFAGYMGSLYGAGCTQYEWRDTHADDSVHRFFTALLDFVGAKKNAETTLEERADIRVANPLVDAAGNMLSTITSFANHQLPSFVCRTYLPKDVKPPKAVFFTKESSREVKKLPFKYDAARHAVVTEVPSFRVFGNLLFIQNAAYPLVSVTMAGTTDCYRLPDMRPGEVREAKVKVFNLSSEPLAAGQLTLRLPEGWYYDRESVEVDRIGAFGESAEMTFKIRTPSVCTARRLKPVNFIYQSEKKVSTPAVEMVWFQDEPQEVAAGELR